MKNSYEKKHGPIRKGGSGGGLEGEDGLDAINSNTVYKGGKGGKIDSGGDSSSDNGSFGYGGNQTTYNCYGGGGGGGYFGGGSAYYYGGSGGGGSGFVHKTLLRPILINGNTPMPNPYSLIYDRHGNIGDGVIKISKIESFSCAKRNSTISHIIIVILIIGK